jgi:hypothetical protein
MYLIQLLHANKIVKRKKEKQITKKGWWSGSAARASAGQA